MASNLARQYTPARTTEAGTLPQLMTAGAGWLAVAFRPTTAPCARDHANEANEKLTSRAVGFTFAARHSSPEQLYRVST
jgi:hypothetical protein